ncbi:MAG: porin family protein [Gammaproteobacteria bacterium]|nr:porin family protein [Gammaproteobacteria bacterium]
MRNKLFIGIIALGLAPVAFASGDNYTMPAPAAPAFVPGVYVGLQAGYGMTNWDNWVKGSGAKTSNDDGLAGRVFVGYDFHPNFAIEAGYTTWFNEPTIKDGSGNKLNEASTYPWAIDVVGKIKAHVYENFGLYAKLGADYIYDKLNNKAGSGWSDAGSDNINLVYGAGAYYDFTNNITADVSWTRFDGLNTPRKAKGFPSLDLFAAGVSYKFDLA